MDQINNGLINKTLVPINPRTNLLPLGSTYFLVTIVPQENSIQIPDYLTGMISGKSNYFMSFDTLPKGNG